MTVEGDLETVQILAERRVEVRDVVAREPEAPEVLHDCRKGMTLDEELHDEKGQGIGRLEAALVPGGDPLLQGVELTQPGKCAAASYLAHIRDHPSRAFAKSSSP